MNSALLLLPMGTACHIRPHSCVLSLCVCVYGGGLVLLSGVYSPALSSWCFCPWDSPFGGARPREFRRSTHALKAKRAYYLGLADSICACGCLFLTAAVSVVFQKNICYLRPRKTAGSCAQRGAQRAPIFGWCCL